MKNGFGRFAWKEITSEGLIGLFVFVLANKEIQCVDKDIHLLNKLGNKWVTCGGLSHNGSNYLCLCVF